MDQPLVDCSQGSTTGSRNEISRNSQSQTVQEVSSPAFLSHAAGVNVQSGTLSNVVNQFNNYHGLSTAHSPGEVQRARGNVEGPTLARSSTSPQPTAQHDSEVYARLLMPKKQGFPLWDPEPPQNLPAAYRRNGVRFGDVGLITSSGLFEFLFNICHPADDPINDNCVPDNFRPLENVQHPRNIHTKPRAYTNGMHIASGSIEKSRSSGFTFSFQCSVSEGAILMLPEGGSQEDHLNLTIFRKYAAQNAERWYLYANGPLRGREAANGSIYLVTGCDKGKSWGTASFSNVSSQAGFSLGFTTAVEASEEGSANFTCSWDQPGFAATKAGPLNAGFDGSRDRPDNQCMFIRGFKVSLSDRLWAIIFGPVEGATIVPSGGSTPYCSQSIEGSGQPPSNDIGVHNHANDVILTLVIPPTTETYHPSSAINLHLLEQMPEANVAVTHDDIWCSVIEESENVIPNACELFGRINGVYEVAYKDGAVFFDRKVIEQETPVIGTSSPNRVTSDMVEEPGKPTTMILKRIWTGGEKLVISIDCGTTYTGVAYALLHPQGFPVINRVTDWPGQVEVDNAKIPTLAWYNHVGIAQCFGAEADAIAISEGESKGWELARNFKLHLHPATIKAECPIVLSPLPNNVPIGQVYADFFRYIYAHTQWFFEQREYQGATLWQRLAQRKNIEFVIVHPNGWTAHEQAFLRKAVVDGGLVSLNDTPEAVHMITDGEAAVHFLIIDEAIGNKLQHCGDFIVCDAGGSTVDTTSYTVKKVSPQLELQEKQPSSCVQAGGIFVNEMAEEFLAATFRLGNISDDVLLPSQEIKEGFESRKMSFTDSDRDEIRLNVGMSRMNVSSINVKRGLLTISGSQVAEFFSRPVREIVARIREQKEDRLLPVTPVMLLGGFGDSPYLRQEVRRQLAGSYELHFTNQSNGKAGADGAVAWYILRSVTHREASLPMRNHPVEWFRIPRISNVLTLAKSPLSSFSGRPASPPPAMSTRAEERFRFFEYPRILDVPALTDSALLSFTLIEPFYSLDRGSEHRVVVDIADKIVYQADLYLDAIRGSIRAAEDGSTFAQDAIEFCDFIADDRERHTVDDLRRFLWSMLELAEHAHDRAVQTMNRFRSIRSGLFQICREFPQVEAERNTCNIILPDPVNVLGTPPSSYRTLAPRPFREVLPQLRQAQNDIESLLEHVRSFADWWMKMKMGLRGLENVIPEMRFDNSNALRSRNVRKRWERLDEEYSHYAQKISAIQDYFPKVARKPPRVPDSQILDDRPRSSRHPADHTYSDDPRQLGVQSHPMYGGTGNTREEGSSRGARSLRQSARSGGGDYTFIPGPLRDSPPPHNPPPTAPAASRSYSSSRHPPHSTSRGQADEWEPSPTEQNPLAPGGYQPMGFSNTSMRTGGPPSSRSGPSSMYPSGRGSIDPRTGPASGSTSRPPDPMSSGRHATSPPFIDPYSRGSADTRTGPPPTTSTSRPSDRTSSSRHATSSSSSSSAMPSRTGHHTTTPGMDRGGRSSGRPDDGYPPAGSTDRRSTEQRRDGDRHVSFSKGDSRHGHR